MQEISDILLAQARAFSMLEAIAVVLAVLYLLLAIKQNIWCWFCAGISTAIFVYLFFDVALYMEAALNVFYFGMAIYGWRTWSLGTSGQALPVVVWPFRRHLLAIIMVLAASAASGFLLATRTDAAFPYIDSLTSWAAIWATYLTAHKVLENWWYWLAIDVTMAYIFWVKELELTAVLYTLYLILIPIGLLSWSRTYRTTPK